MSARACTITGRVALTLALPAHAHVRIIQQICAIHKTSLNNTEKCELNFQLSKQNPCV